MRFFVLLFFLGYANLSLAIGLGDITLRSHLGEPLSASIPITDVENSPDTGCFSIEDNSDVPAFRKATPAFKQSGDSYRLNISTHDPIHEPVINLLVTFNCEPSLSRQYVLLLDPAEFSHTSSANDAQIQSETVNSKTTAPSKVSNSKTDVSSDAAEGMSSTASMVTAKKQKLKRKKISTISEVDRKLAEAYTGKSPDANHNPDTPATRSNLADGPATRAHGGTSKPQLIISGGSISSGTPTSLPQLSLKLETQIDFTRAAAEAPVSTTDTLDEITVMANRLAHLEKQIASLQSRNAQLQSEAKKAKEEARNANSLSELLRSWSQYLLIFIGIISLFISGEWIRRKAIRSKLDRDEAIWFNESHRAPVHDVSSIFPPDDSGKADESLLDELSFSNTASPQGHNASGMLAEHTNDDNVLENADVFIAHERPALAIQLLQNHLIDFPSESPKIWLKLLSLLAREGSEEDYNRTASECKQFFNIKMPSFAEAGIEDTSSIEDYPHILTRLEGVWGSQYAVGFLNDLIYNQQSQPREGFGRGTFDDLFFLKKVAETLSASNVKEQTSFYKPTSIEPKLENVAFNKETFGNANLAGDADTSNEARFMQTGPEDEVDEFNLADNLFSTTLEESAFQQVPAYEVDMLSDLDSALAVEDTLPQQRLLNSELAPRLQTSENGRPSVKDELQSEEILFPVHEFPSPEPHAAESADSATSLPELDSFDGSEDIFNIKESTPTQNSNLIEWDLPDEDRPKKNQSLPDSKDQ